MSIDFPKEMIFDRKLSSEQINLLKSQYQRFIRLSYEKLDDNQYQLFLNKNKGVYLPKDALVFGTSSSIENLVEIKENGILASEFKGKSNNNGNFYCVSFYKVKKDILLSSFDKKINIDDEMPFNTRNDNVAFIINSTSKIGGLLYYDLMDSKFNANLDVKSIIDIASLKNKDKRAAILVGVPSNFISGIVLGDNVVLNAKLVDEIKRLFPSAYIVTRQGNIIRDRSNMIKIEDYEKIAFEYCNEKIRREILEKENNSSKKEISSLLEAIISNTTYLQQVKILLAIGHYNIPTGLINKLTEEEKNSLNLKIGKSDKK